MTNQPRQPFESTTLTIEQLYAERAQRLTALYNGCERELPPLYPAYVDPDIALVPDLYAQQVRTYHSLYAEVDYESFSAGHERLGLTKHEEWEIQAYAKHFMGSQQVVEHLKAAYAAWFPARKSKLSEARCATACQEAQIMLQTLLERATLVPRVAAYCQSSEQRDELFQYTLGPHWKTYVQSGTVLETTVQRVEDAVAAEPFLYELPFADFVRIPPNQRTAIASHLAAETLEFTELLLQHYTKAITTPRVWPYGGKGLAVALMNGSLTVLKKAMAAAPLVPPKQLLHSFIEHGSTGLLDNALQLQEHAERLKSEAAAEAERWRLERVAAAAAAATLAKEAAVAAKQTAYREAYEGLLADPEVKAELARLEPGILAQIGSEGELMHRPDFERIIEKHMRLVGYALRDRAQNDPVNPHPYSIHFEGQLDNDAVNVGALLTDGYYGKRENLWISVLPFDEASDTAKFTKRGWSLVDTHHVVRLCVAVDLRSSGKEPVTNMVDALVCVRRIKNKEQSEVSILLRKPSLGQGVDYLRAAASLRGYKEQQWQLGHIRQGGIPGAGKTRKHS